jgi:hypothetical protein
MKVENRREAIAWLGVMLAGRSIAGIHFSPEAADAIRSDPRYFDLKKRDRELLDNLVDLR